MIVWDNITVLQANSIFYTQIFNFLLNNIDVVQTLTLWGAICLATTGSSRRECKRVKKHERREAPFKENEHESRKHCGFPAIPIYKFDLEKNETSPQRRMRNLICSSKCAFGHEGSLETWGRYCACWLTWHDASTSKNMHGLSERFRDFLFCSIFFKAVYFKLESIGASFSFFIFNLRSNKKFLSRVSITIKNCNFRSCSMVNVGLIAD